MLSFFSCGEDSVKVVNNSKRIIDIERRLDVVEKHVQMYKCDLSSQESLLKVGSNFYMIANTITTETIQVIAGATDLEIPGITYCQHKNDSNNTKLPNSDGECFPINSWNKIEGSPYIVPSFTVGNQLVITSTKVSLEHLAAGAYLSDDGILPCDFEINSDGSTNLMLLE
jgi:hypothetical protein